MSMHGVSMKIQFSYATFLYLALNIFYWFGDYHIYSGPTRPYGNKVWETHNFTVVHEKFKQKGENHLYPLSTHAHNLHQR